MEAPPPKPLTILIGELVARAGSLQAGTFEIREPDLVINLARRLRQPPAAVRRALAQLHAAGVVACSYQDNDDSAALFSLRFVPKANRPPRKRPVTPAKPPTLVKTGLPEAPVKAGTPVPPISLPPATPPNPAPKPTVIEPVEFHLAEAESAAVAGPEVVDEPEAAPSDPVTLTAPKPVMCAKLANTDPVSVDIAAQAPQPTVPPGEQAFAELTDIELEVFRVLCIFANDQGEGSEVPSVVIRRCIRMPSTRAHRILARLESDGFIVDRLIMVGYRVNTERRAALFPSLPPYDPERGPGVEPPSVKVLDNSLTLADVGELDTTCRRILLVMRRAAPGGYTSLWFYRDALRSGWRRAGFGRIDHSEIDQHIRHLVQLGLFRGYRWGYEVNLSVPVEGDDI